MVEDPDGHPVTQHVGPGCTIFVPEGRFHSTLNTGAGPMQLFVVYSPAGPGIAARPAGFPHHQGWVLGARRPLLRPRVACQFAPPLEEKTMAGSEHTLSWRKRPYHRQWLYDEANRHYEFFQVSSFNPRGGFHELDNAGRPLSPDNAVRQIHVTGRMVHSFVMGSLMGRPGSDEMVDHGLRYLWEGHRDSKYGGYMWSLDNDRPVDDKKQAYGHAFVLLAASGGKLLGHPLADKLLADVTEVINTHFWDDKAGAMKEEFARDWSAFSDYRGQNSNMHSTEALMAAFEATSDDAYLDKARRIASRIIGQHAKVHDFRVVEHFDEQWILDKDYRNGDMFRPYGTTPGHWLEWSRLLLQLWVLDGKRAAWMLDAAVALFKQATELGWDKQYGGFFYTLGWDDKPHLNQKLWWPVAEGIGAASFLSEHAPSAFHEEWYRKLWDFAGNHLVDRKQGSWHSELSVDLQPGMTLFDNKPDIYHALQACVIPLYPASGSVTRGILGSLTT